MLHSCFLSKEIQRVAKLKNTASGPGSTELILSLLQDSHVTIARPCASLGSLFSGGSLPGLVL